jgi:hypothetical protein
MLKVVRAFLAILIALTMALGLAPASPTLAAGPDPRTFSETGYRIDRDSFWDFFRVRGGTRTFGYPVSGSFLFQGCSVQFFQRLIVQQCGAQEVGTLNLLDDGLLPYTRINGSTFPASEPALQAGAPSPRDASYGEKVLRFVRENAVDTFEGEPVNFGRTFLSTVSAAEAFPDGRGDANLLPLINLQIWGLPTSRPSRDPANHDFVYQRFQRGIMHYNAACRCTQGLLLADYLKAVITGQNVPGDLAATARSSPLFRSAVGARPPAGTDYSGAFAGLQAAVVLTAEQQRFVARVGGAARELRERTGLPPSLVVAMAINETGWGESVLARQAANYFGIKALTGSGTAGVLSVDTWEVLDGKTVQVQAPFRAYRTFEDGLLDLGAFLRKNPRYGMVWQAGSDPVAVARAMHKAGYATDPAWPDKLTRIIERYGLRTLDVA